MPGAAHKQKCRSWSYCEVRGSSDFLSPERVLNQDSPQMLMGMNVPCCWHRLVLQQGLNLQDENLIWS